MQRIDTNTREQKINDLPDSLLAEAKRELESLEWFIALKTNADEDEAIFTLALEMQEERRLQAAMRATDHLATLSEQMDAATEKILAKQAAGNSIAIAEAMEQLEAHVPLDQLDEAERIKNAKQAA